MVKVNYAYMFCVDESLMFKLYMINLKHVKFPDVHVKLNLIFKIYHCLNWNSEASKMWGEVPQSLLMRFLNCGSLVVTYSLALFRILFKHSGYFCF